MNNNLAEVGITAIITGALAGVLLLTISTCHERNMAAQEYKSRLSPIERVCTEQMLDNAQTKMCLDYTKPQQGK